MKGKLVSEFKSRGIRKVAGRKVESYSFYELCGFYTRIIVKGEEIK